MKKCAKGIICLLVLVTLLTACKSRRPLSPAQNLPSASMQVLREHGKEVKTLQMRLQTSISGSTSVSSKMSVRVVMDSAVWISVQPFMGIEVARLCFYKDQMYAIDKLHHNVCIMAYSDLPASWHASLSMVQGLLCNRFFDPFNADYQNFVCDTEADLNRYHAADNEFSVSFWYVAQALQRTNVSLSQSQFAELVYTRFEQQLSHNFATAGMANLSNGKEQYMVQWDVERYSFNETVDVSTGNISTYKQLGWQQFMKALF